MEIIRDSLIGYAARWIAPHKFRYPDETAAAAAEILAKNRNQQSIASPPGTPSYDSDSPKPHPFNDSESQPRSTIPPNSPLVEIDPKPIICDWNGDDDPENPRNWPRARKLFVVANIAFCSFVVYGTAPIWTPSTEAFMSEYGTGHEYTSLGLSLFVLGYGLGPLLFSPLSEIPQVGRNIPYATTFFLYTLVSVPLALVRNAPAFMFLRFLQGFLGSPILATGGASLSDVYGDEYLPFGISAWATACFVAPAFGPIVSSAALPSLGWRFSMWEVLIASVPILVLLLLWPETSGATILHQRAARLRKQTGNNHIRTRAEIAHREKPSARDVVVEALLMPARITALDPAILFTNVYMMLVYGIYYSFFESFPLVWGPVYGFGLLQQNLAFIPFIVGTSLALLAYTAYLYYYRLPRTLAGKRTYPEQVLLPAMASCFLPPIGILVFGWTARSDVHWIVPMVGVTMYPMGVFVIFQGLFLYLPQMYPQYAASLFAAADMTRSVFAVAAIHFARPLFLTLGIGGGCSLLAGLMVVCIFGLYALYYFGPALRARSKFAEAS